MKTRIEKHEAEKPPVENQEMLPNSPMNLSVVVTADNLAAYMVPGEKYLELMGTFDFDPELFKEFEDMEAAEKAARHRSK